MRLRRRNGWSPVQIVSFGTRSHSYRELFCCNTLFSYSISSLLCKRIWFNNLISHFQYAGICIIFMVQDIAVSSWGQHSLHLFCYSIIPSVKKCMNAQSGRKLEFLWVHSKQHFDLSICVSDPNILEKWFPLRGELQLLFRPCYSSSA